MSKNRSLVVDASFKASTSLILPRLPILSSYDASWEGIYLRYHVQPAWETPEYCSTFHAISVHNFQQTEASEARTERWLEGRMQHEHIFAGEVAVIPAGMPQKVNWDRESDFTGILLQPEQISTIACEVTNGDRVDLVPQSPKPDPLIYGIGLALKAELESGFSSRLYVETLTNTLAIHLLHCYCTRQYATREYENKLPDATLQVVLDYIHEHLDQGIRLSDLATLIGKSPHYFSTLFKQSIGLSPYRYVIQCRVERAKQLLLQGELTIAEVAAHVGFSHQSHLNRHFKRLYGVTPKTILKR